jgi:Flp pilus assembly protein TadG
METINSARKTVSAGRWRRGRVPASGDRRGVAAVEFVVLAPCLIIFLLGTFEMARGLMVKEVLNDAARRACRLGIQPNKANADVTATIANIMKDNNMPTTHVTTTIQVNGATVDCSTAQQNDKVSVKISIPTSDTFWISTFFLKSSSLESDSITMMRQD